MLWPRGRVLLYTVAAWIAASRVLIGQHYFTDVVAGAILGTVFPYFVRERFAARRWLFERTPDGGYRIRGVRTQRWLGWPHRKGCGLEDARLAPPSESTDNWDRELSIRRTPQGGSQIARPIPI